MVNTAKKRYKILFFILPRKSKVDNGFGENKKSLKRARQPWVFFGILIFIGAVIFVYLKNNHGYISNKLSEYLNRCTNHTLTIPEVRHIGFLKVHKAGGSTVQNILFRFGLKRHLSFVMPANSYQYKFSTYGGKSTKLLRNRGNSYDILALHSVYNEPVYKQVLPSDAVNIAIIREPLALMISGAYFHRDVWHVQYLKEVPTENFIKTLIRYPELYDQNEFSLTRNSMAMDFGFPVGLHVTDTEEIKKYLEYLNSKFSLVLLLERFDESVILFKRLLHWKLEDVLYIPLNVYQHPSEQSLNISMIDRRKFLHRNFLDVAIYRYFNDKFISVVSALGIEFQEEVNYFRRVRKEVEKHCLSETKRIVPFLIEESQWNSAFVVTKDNCEDMQTEELKFIDKIRASMRFKMARNRRTG